MSILTDKEEKWLKRIQKLLNECPSKRIGFYTIGDSALQVYNREMEQEIHETMNNNLCDFCNAVDEHDAHFNIDLKFPTNVHSTSG